MPPTPSEQVAASQNLPTLEAGRPAAETVRASIRKVVLKPAEAPGNEEVAGDYDKSTYDLYSGAATGAGATTIHKQAGPVNVSIPIPILQLPGMIAGGIAGATQKEIQEFRDELTDELGFVIEAKLRKLELEKRKASLRDRLRDGIEINIDDRVFLHRASEPLKARLMLAGFKVHEVELTEFLKAGGSAKCLSLKLTEPVRER